ncbi:Putative glucose-6-phosphate 1-epimerase, partial [Linum perenne]
LPVVKIETKTPRTNKPTNGQTEPNSLYFLYIIHQTHSLIKPLHSPLPFSVSQLSKLSSINIAAYKLEWKKGKANPVVSNLRAKLRINPMPLMSVFNDGNGFPRIVLADPSGSTAEVLLYGGQVVSWKNERREELLFMSSKAVWKPPKAIRGGIPVFFPQFGSLGSLEKNGFARNRFWAIDNDPSPLPPSNNHSSVDLLLKSTNEDLKVWPRSAGKLTLIPRVRNTDTKPFTFTFALRNYLSVSDISEVRVEGLETLDYFDNLMQRERFTEQADAITFDGEVNRVYLSTPPKIAIIDHEKKRTLVLRKDGMPDAGMWNPWDKKSKVVPDFGYDDYKTMLCVDSAVTETPIVLKPMEEWKGYQELSTVSSSYCSGQLDPRKVLCGF